MKESRGRLSYCPPGRTKFITAKKLSKKLEKEQVLTALSQNIQLGHHPSSSERNPDKIRKLVDIQANVAAGKGIGYERWAKKFNLKRWSQNPVSPAGEKLLSEDATEPAHVELQTQHDDALAVVKRHGCPHGLLRVAGILWFIGKVQALAQKSPDRAESRQVWPKGAHRAELAVYECRLRLFQGQRASDTAGPQKLMPNTRPPFEKNGFYTCQESADRTA